MNALSRFIFLSLYTRLLSKAFEFYQKEMGQHYAQQQQQHWIYKPELTGVTTLKYPTSSLVSWE
jgi:hypothetical protein